MKKILAVTLFLLISPTVFAQKWKCTYKDFPEQEFAYEITISTQPKLFKFKTFWREDDGAIASEEEVMLDEQKVYKPMQFTISSGEVREENNSRAYSFSWKSRGDGTIYGSLNLDHERASGAFTSHWDWSGSTVSRTIPFEKCRQIR